MKPGGGIAYGGNADVKDPDGTTGVGILDEVGPLPDMLLYWQTHTKNN